jgi:gluconokinase
MPRLPLIVMGVSGSGKTTVGSRLADAFDMPFIDGDDLHPASNVAKMAAGIPLEDADRLPWLDTIAHRIADELAAGRPIVVACSALTRRYRDRLVALASDSVFVHLDGDRDLVTVRQRDRDHAFMPTTLLASQFELLEPLQADERGIVVDVRKDPDAIVDDVRVSLEALEQR